MGLARRLPLVLRGRHILSEGLGKAKEDGPGKKDPSPEPVPNSDPGPRPAVQDGPRGPGDDGVPVQGSNPEPSPVRTPGSQLSLPSTPQSEGVGPPLRKYGPLAPVPVPATPGKQVVQEESNLKVPSPRSKEEEDRERLSVFLRRTYRQRDPAFSCWINSPTWSTVDGQRGFKSGVGTSSPGPGLTTGVPSRGTSSRGSVLLTRTRASPGPYRAGGSPDQSRSLCRAGDPSRRGFSPWPPEQWTLLELPLLLMSRDSSEAGVTGRLSAARLNGSWLTWSRSSEP